MVVGRLSIFRWALAAVCGLTATLAAGVCLADPPTLTCHQDTFWTPKLPPGFTDVDVSGVTSDDPSVVVASKRRKGGGTSGAIELTAQGQSGVTTVHYFIRDAYTGQVARIETLISVDCPEHKRRRGVTGHEPIIGHDGPKPGPPGPPPPPPPPRGHYPQAHPVQTSCEACRNLERQVNQQVEVYNGLVDDHAPAAKIGAAQAHLRQLANELNACERQCQAASASQGVLRGIGVAPPKPGQPNTRSDSETDR